jgi:ribonuclease E
MKAKFAFALAGMVAMIAASVAAAAPIGTAKARGDYRPFWQSQLAPVRVASRGYARRATTSAVAVEAPVAAPAAQPQVAQAPAEGRRFSYEPAQAPAAAAPATTMPMTAAPTTAPAPRYYAPRVHCSSSRTTLDRWALPKTDPRKYLTH